MRRSSKHRRAEINPDDVGDARIEREIPTSTDSGVQQAARQSLEEERPDAALAAVFERQIGQIVKRRDSLISFKVGRHTGAYAGARRDRRLVR